MSFLEGLGPDTFLRHDATKQLEIWIHWTANIKLVNLSQRGWYFEAYPHYRIKINSLKV